MNQLKVVLIGDKKTGKTSYARYMMNAPFVEIYIPTLGVDVFNINKNHDGTDYNIAIWDTAGDDKYGGLRDGYYLEADGAIVFRNGDEARTNKMVEDFMKHNPGKPIVNVFAKVDLPQEYLLAVDNEFNYDNFIGISVLNNIMPSYPMSLLIDLIKG